LGGLLTRKGVGGKKKGLRKERGARKGEGEKTRKWGESRV